MSTLRLAAWAPFSWQMGLCDCQDKKAAPSSHVIETDNVQCFLQLKKAMEIIQGGISIKVDKVTNVFFLNAFVAKKKEPINSM